MNWYVRSILALVAISLQAATTTVTGTYNTVEGRPANGVVIVTVTRAFTAVDGKAVPVQKKVYQIKNGQLSIALEPNSGSTPESFYTITTTIDGGPPENTIWIVPVSSTTVTVASVVSSAPPTASQTIPPQQIRGTGASVGDTLQFNGSNYAPAPAAPGGVTSVNTQTGDVVLTPGDIGAQSTLGFTPENTANKNASNGYAGLSGGLLSNSQIPTAIDVAKLADGSVSNTELQYLDGVTSAVQTQINSKIDKGTVVMWVDDYCSVSGTYNQTCLSGALTAAPSSDFRLMFSNRNYTFASGVSVTSKSNFTIEMLPGGKITMGTNIGAPAITFTSIDQFRVIRLTIDGARASQSSTAHAIYCSNCTRYLFSDNYIYEVNGRAFDLTATAAPSVHSYGFFRNNHTKNTNNEAVNISETGSGAGGTPIELSGNIAEGVDADLNFDVFTGAFNFVGMNVKSSGDFIQASSSTFIGCGLYLDGGGSGFVLTAIDSGVNAFTGGGVVCAGNGATVQSINTGIATSYKTYPLVKCNGTTATLSGPIAWINSAVTPVCTGGTMQFGYIPMPAATQTGIVLEIDTPAYSSGTTWNIDVFGMWSTTTGNANLKIQYSTSCGLYSGNSISISSGPTFSAATDLGAINGSNTTLVSAFRQASGIAASALCSSGGGPTYLKIERPSTDTYGGEFRISQINIRYTFKVN